MKKIQGYVLMVLWIFMCCLGVQAEEIHTELSTPEEFSQWCQSDSTTFSTLNFVRRTGIVGGADKITYFSLMEIDGTLVYCIEPHIYAGTGQNYEIDWGVLDEYTKQRLFNITNVGYGRYGHNEDRWFVATQLVVWRALGYTQYYAMTMDGAYWDLSSEIAEIEQMANSFGNTASFSGQTLTLDLNESRTIKDNRGILSQFQVKSVKGVDVVQNGNEMTVTIVDRDYQKSISGSKGITTGGLVYVLPGKQTVYMVHRSEEPISYQLKLKLNTIDLRLVKQDPYGNSASGTHHFKLLDENGEVVIEDIEVKKGVADVKGYLTKGTYILKETSTVYPYVLSDSEQVIELSEENKEFVVVNELVEIDLHLVKKDAKTGELLDGAEFTVYTQDEEENWIPWIKTETGGKYIQVSEEAAGTVLKLVNSDNASEWFGEFAVDEKGRIDIGGYNLNQDVVVMDQEGQMISSDLVDHTGIAEIKGIEYGQVLQVCETKAPVGYQLSEDACRVIVIDDETLIQTEEFANEKRLLDVQLMKCDRSDHNLLLNDAYFTIENLSTLQSYNLMSGRLVVDTSEPFSLFQVYRDELCTDLIFEEISDETGQWIGQVDENEVYVQFENQTVHYRIDKGTVWIEDVTYGDVLSVCEVIAPSGYHRNEECQFYEIKSQEDLFQIWFENERIRIYDAVPTMGID